MLDGAGASTFLDLIDERSQVDNSNKSIQEVKKFKELKSENGSKELPFTNVPRDQLKRKQIVFIDKQVPDFEKLSKSFRKNVEIHFIETNEDGFKKIEQTLKNGKKYSAIHIIGHGSAGQILFGNALLTNESIENYKSTLGNIGESLTKKGDILFYGCNIAANEKGEALLKKISNLTKADIAASNDLTGKDGDWDLEKKYGIVETKNVKVVDYKYYLGTFTDRYNDTQTVGEDGIASIKNAYIKAYTGDDRLTDFSSHNESSSKYFSEQYTDKYTNSGATDQNFRYWRISREKAGIDSGKITHSNNSSIYVVGGGTLNASTTKLDSYILFMDENRNNNTDRTRSVAQVTFDNDIKAVIYGTNTGKTTVGTMDFSVSGSGNTYGGDGKRGLEFKGHNNPYSTSSSGTQEKDWFHISGSKLFAGAKNKEPGDYIRVLVEAEANKNPVAADYTKSVTENTYSKNPSYFSIRDNSTDADGDTLTVTHIKYDKFTNDGDTSVEPGEVANDTDEVGQNFKKFHTKYGVFYIRKNGDYSFDAASQKIETYDANDTVVQYSNRAEFNEVNKLDNGDTATLTFTYTISDGNGGTDTGDITINILGVNDTPIAVNDTNSVSEEGTITKSSTTSSNKELVDNDTDADGDDNSSNFTITGIAAGSTETNSFTTISSGGQQTIETSLGTLTVHNDGSYSYVAKKNPAIGSGETATDYFRYKLRDDSGESNVNTLGSSIPTPEDKNSIGILEITINGIDDSNNAPVTTDDTGYVYEDFTLTVANDASANDGFSSSPFTGDFEIASDSDNNSNHGDHTGDVLSNDSDADGDTLNITGIRISTATGPFDTTTFSSVASSSSYNSNGTEVAGSYGTLTIGADGSYSYAATAAAADVLDNNETIKEYFQYKINDGTDDALGNITITVKGINDDPVGVNDTDAVTLGSTLSRANGNEYDLLIDDTDIDGDDDESDFTITSITATTAGGSAQTTFSSNTETVSGQYGTLVLNSNGSYTYDPTGNANTIALADGATANDVFTYIFNDGTSKLTEHSSGSLKTNPSGTGTLTITVTGRTPSAADDTGRINAGSTLTVTDGSSGEDGTDTDKDNESGDHTGDVLENDTGSSTAVTGIQLGTESDPGGTGSVGSVFQGNYGDLTINADGSYTYNANNAGTLLAGETATETFTYTVTDSTGKTDTATITITILGVDDAPAAVNDTGYIQEASTLTVEADEGVDGTDDNNNNESGDTSGGALENDSDADGDSTMSITTYSHTSATNTAGGSASTGNGNSGTAGSDSVVGFYGTLTLAADGSYTYAANEDISTLDTGETVTDVFTYTLTDSDGDTANDTATITITISGISAPSAANNTATVEENSTLSVSNGASANSETAATHAGASDSFAVHTQENEGTGISFSSDGKKMYITGHAQNKIHQWDLSTAFDPSTKSNLVSKSTDWNGVDNSGDGDFSDDQGDWTRGHTWNVDGTKLFVLNWDGGVAGDSTASYRICSYDASSPFEVSSLTIAAPTSSTSFDTGFTPAHLNISMSNDGKTFHILYRFSKVLQQIDLTTAYDLSTASNGTSYSLAAVVSGPRSFTFSEDGKRLFVGCQSNDKIYQFSLDNAFDVTPGSLTLDGNINLLNSNTMPFGITFGAGGTKMFVHEIDGNDTIEEYALRTPYNLIDLDGEHDGDVLEDDTDTDGVGTLVVASVRTGSTEGSGTEGTLGDALTGTYGNLTLNADGSYSYTANTGISATEALDAGDIVYDYFNYTVSDGTGTDTALITIKVIGVNDAPSASADTGHIHEGGTLTVSNGGLENIGTTSGSNSGDVLLNDTDVDADDTLIVVGTVFQIGGTNTAGGSVSSNGNTADVGVKIDGIYGDLTLNADGSYSYIANDAASLNNGETVTDIFSLTTSDTQGGTASSTLTITIIGKGADLTNDTDAVNEDATITVSDGDDEDLLVDDFGVTSVTSVAHTSGTDGDGSALASTGNSASAGSAVIGQYGTLTVQSNGSYVYVTDIDNNEDALVAGATATDVFTYTAGGETATLTITITGLGPLAANDTAAFTEGGSAATGTAGIAGTGVLGNDDNGGSSYEAEHASLQVTQAKPDGGSYTAVASGGSSNIVGTYGTLTLYSTGEYSYTADQSAAEAITKDATVTDTFVYEIKDDDDVNASTANIVVTITGINDDIIAVDDTDSVDEGKSVTRGNTSEYSLDYDDTDTDSGNTYLTHQITAIRTGSSEGSGTAGTIGDPLIGTYGKLTVYADGSYTYQANNDIKVAGSRIVSGQTVTDTFNYTVSDTDGDTDIAVLTITINGTNEAPTATDDYNTITVGGSAISKTDANGVDSNDADMEGDTITVNGIRTGDEGETGTSGTVGSPLTGTYGTLTLNSDGSYTYELDPNNSDLKKIPAGHSFYEIFTYTITDEAGQTATAQLTIKINGINDAPSAVNDNETLDLDEETQITNFDNSSKLITANDTDIDILDVLSINSIRSGKINESGSSITLGSEFTAQYGSITFFDNGGYNYNSNSGLRDTLKPGESLFEYFTYTVTDINGLTASAQLTIEIFGSTNYGAEFKEDGLKSLVQRASLNELDPYVLPDRAPLPFTNFYEGQFKILRFNEALKLIDLRAQFIDKDGNNTTFSEGNPEDTLVLQFSVFNDPGVKLVKYKGEMKDGSELPSWIKVNPKTGVVITEIPFDVDLLEFKVIGIDEKNNEYEIAVLIDANQLRQNRELAREFAGEIEERISVNQDGDVEIQSDEEQTNNETENKSINGNDAKLKPKKLIEKIAKGEVYKPKPYIRDNKYIIDLPDEIKSNLEKGIAVLRNGEKTPKWVKVDKDKGELILNPPKNLKHLNLSVISIDADGNKIKNDIKGKINKRSAERFAKQIEIKELTKFVSLTEQVGVEANIQDDYGSDILSRL